MIFSPQNNVIPGLMLFGVPIVMPDNVIPDLIRDLIRHLKPTHHAEHRHAGLDPASHRPGIPLATYRKCAPGKETNVNE